MSKNILRFNTLNLLKKDYSLLYILSTEISLILLIIISYNKHRKQSIISLKNKSL